jgi:hypothetical protein
MLAALSLVAVGGMLACAPARATWLPPFEGVPPFKGNDTGGIIAYSLASQADARQIAVDHCARCDKVVKFLAVQPYQGGTSRSPAAGYRTAPPTAAAHPLLNRIG